MDTTQVAVDSYFALNKKKKEKEKAVTLITASEKWLKLTRGT